MNTQAGASNRQSSTGDANNQRRGEKTQETSKTEQVKQAAQETASSAAREIKHTAGAAAKEAQQSLSEVASQAKEQVTEATEQMKQQAGEKIQKQKLQASDRLEGVASALRDTGRKLHEQDEDTFAQYVDSLADQVDKASTYLRDMNIKDMASEVRSFAQREPEMFLLGSLAAGFLVGRFLRSSQANAYPQTHAYNPGESGYTSPYRQWSSEQEPNMYAGATAYDAAYDTGYGAEYATENSVSG